MSIEDAKQVFVRGYGSHLIGSQNVYGSLYKDGTYDSFNYACHSKLGGDYCRNPDAIIISAIYLGKSEGPWGYSEQNKYFEYILDHETSPWRQLLNYEGFEYEVIRKDGLVQFIVVKSMDINRYILFSFLKGFRQVWERGTALRFFTDSVGNVEASELYEIFLMSQLYRGGNESVKVEWGGDHHVFKGPPSEALRKREMIDFEEKIKEDLYSEANFYFDRDLQIEVWGSYDTSTFREYETDVTRVLQNDQKEYGYFFTSPTSDDSKIITLEQFKQNFMKVRDYFSNKGVSFA